MCMRYLKVNLRFLYFIAYDVDHGKKLLIVLIMFIKLITTVFIGQNSLHTNCATTTG